MKWFIKMGITTALTVSVTTTAFGALHIEASDWAVPIMEKAYELELIPEELFARATENMTRKEFTTLAIQFYQKVTGEKVLKEIKIKPDVVDPDDVEMLEDLILTCVNEALRKVDSAQSQELGKFNIPGFM